MKCRDALERMLEAEPATLRGEGDADPALAGHLRTCARCRRVATALAAELRELDAGLEALASPRTTRGERRSLHRSARTWGLLAAAAAVAAVLLIPRGGAPPLEETTSGAPAATDADGSRVAVTLPADRGGAVLSTTNPNITVVWLYERSER